MTITIECDSDQPRNPDNQPPPYRDDALVVRPWPHIALWGWRCPCGDDDPCTHSEAMAALCLERHLIDAHGE